MHEAVNNIRGIFANYDIGAYIIPSDNEYFIEYPAESYSRLKYMTNFTGSNGLVVIGQEVALFFTDGRYLAQGKRQLDSRVFQIFDIKDLRYFPWSNYLNDAEMFGYDPKLFSNLKLKIFSAIAPRLTKISENLVDQIWSNKPSAPSSQVYIHQVEFAGQTHNDKIAMCRDILAEHSADTMIVTSIDSICWLLNLRANDTPYSPLMLSKVLITNHQLYLFINPSRITKEVALARPEITILPEEKFADLLSQGKKILVDENIVQSHIMDLLNSQLVEKIGEPCQLYKACKNDIEIKHAINFHIEDAVALCEFFAYIFDLTNLHDYDEYELGEILTKFRSKQDKYIMDSFPTICGFKENSAIIHYHATQIQSKKIVGNGILLIDSGGQYQGCTTDVTRTFIIGKPTNEQKIRYTQVLKGHIALSTIKFPANITTGAHLDVLARQFLWNDEQDYPHGTGHGVGSFLGVHEGPQNIHASSNITLKAGMILSNEPGYYKTNDFGIRIENLMYVRETQQNTPLTNHQQFLEFCPLTLVPYAKELIEQKMLNQDEKNYLKQYYQKITSHLSPLLSDHSKQWLATQTLPFTSD